MKLTKTRRYATDFLRRYWLHVLLAAALILVFKGWLQGGVITYGDWSYHSAQRLQGFVGLPSVWDPASGLGTLFLEPLHWYPQNLLWGLLTGLNVSYAWSTRIVWLFPTVVLTALSAYYLGKTLFGSREAACVTAAVYSLNTAFLGRAFGHMTIATSIGLAPLVIALLLRSKRTRGLRYPVLAGLALWLQCSYDLRIGYLTILLAIVGWLVVSLGSLRRGREGILDGVRWGGYLFLALLVFACTSLYWLLPTALGSGGGIQAPGTFAESWWIQALSFNGPVHAITLHDISWPGRAFQELGWATAINPFYLLFPLLGFGAAAAALRSKRRSRKWTPIAVGGVALVLAGVFLVSGANFPDGGRIYTWLFTNLPGFNMFRDPQKMFLFVALGYSILFGLLACMLTDWALRSRRMPCSSRSWSRSVPAAILVVMLCLLILPAFTLSLGGTSRPVQEPEGYLEMAETLELDRAYYRTFWFPDVQRFAPLSGNHPALSAAELLGDQLAALSITEDTLSAIKSPLLPGLLDSMAVGGIVVPEDADDFDYQLYREYSNPELATGKSEFEELAAGVPGNTGETSFGGSTVFKRSDQGDHFYIPRKTVGIIGDWGAALAANGAPGLDMDDCVYFFSEQGENTLPVFQEDSPIKAVVSGEPNMTDATMPFIDESRFIPVSEYASSRGLSLKKTRRQQEWQNIPPGEYNTSIYQFLRSKGNEDRSLDYGFGAAFANVSYRFPAPGWHEQAPLVDVIDMSEDPAPFTTRFNKQLLLETDPTRKVTGGASLRGSLSGGEESPRGVSADSRNVACEPLHPYAIISHVSGERIDEIELYVFYYNNVDLPLGNTCLGGRIEGSFDFKRVEAHFVTPRDTSYLRIEVRVRRNKTSSSAWNLDNVEIYDLGKLRANPQLDVPLTVTDKATYNLMVRTLDWKKGGEISFSVDGGPAAVLGTTEPHGRMSWHNVMKLEMDKGQHQVTIANLGGQNLVNTLALVTDEELAAAGDRLSEGVEGKEVACALDLSSPPEEFSYSSGQLTRKDGVYCPGDRELIPTFANRGITAPKGTVLHVGGTTYYPAEEASHTNVPGWESLPGVVLGRGRCEVELSYPVTALVELPAAGQSAGEGGGWHAVTEGVSLEKQSSSRGEQVDLIGVVQPEVTPSRKIVRSKRFEVEPGAQYTSLVKIEGLESDGLRVALLTFDGSGKQLLRRTLTDEMNGTFEPRTVLKEIKAPREARYACIEVISTSNASQLSGWRLGELLFCETSAVSSPVGQLALVPESFLDTQHDDRSSDIGYRSTSPESGTGGKITESAEASVRVLHSGPTRYKLEIRDARSPFLLVFSEAFSEDWELSVDGKKITPVPVNTLLNGYAIDKEGTYEIRLEYRPQRWVDLGFIVSVLTFVFCALLLMAIRLRKKKQ